MAQSPLKPKRVVHPSPNNKRQGSRTCLCMGVVYLVMVLVLFAWSTSLQYSAQETAMDMASIQIVRTLQQPTASNDFERLQDVEILDHTTVLTTRPKKPIVVAYAVSLIKVCQEKLFKVA